ncbi:1-acyl-sn-glycerol-3-phosphate acyltransferase 3 [Linum grandiflorum]
MPFWLALFAEGTRFTQPKLEAAQEFAASRGLPIPRNVLLPRTKGFVSAVTHLRAFVPAIYDCTVAVPRDQPSPTLLRMFRRQASVINVQIKRYSMQELPETADSISQWCKDIFITKDAVLDKFLTKDTFSDRKRDIGRPKKPLCVFIAWSTLLIWGIASLFRWLSHLGSWEVIAFVVTVLVIVTIGMHILIQSSESEHSSSSSSSSSSTAARSEGVTVVTDDGVQDRLIHK